MTYIRHRTIGKFIEKHKGKLTQQSKRPLQGNDMAAISKNYYLSTDNNIVSFSKLTKGKMIDILSHPPNDRIQSISSQKKLHIPYENFFVLLTLCGLYDFCYILLYDDNFSISITLLYTGHGVWVVLWVTANWSSGESWITGLNPAWGIVPFL